MNLENPWKIIKREKGPNVFAVLFLCVYVKEIFSVYVIGTNCSLRLFLSIDMTTKSIFIFPWDHVADPLSINPLNSCSSHKEVATAA